jgi:hypothetical protein
MPVPVSLARLVSALQFAAPGAGVRIDPLTGDVVEGPEPLPTRQSLPADSSEESSRFRTIAVDFAEHEIAKRFCETVSDRNDRRRLEMALSSAQPIENFENGLYRAGIAHLWFPFRERQLGDLAKAQLEAQGFAFVDDLG